MALLTDAQKQARENERKYVTPIYALHPDSKNDKFDKNVLIYKEKEYPDGLNIVSIDKKHHYTVLNEKFEVIDEASSSSEAAIKETPEYLDLVEKHGEKAVKVSYDFLVYLPDHKAFGTLNVKTYARKTLDALIDKSILNPGLVINVKSDIHSPDWSKFNSKLYLFEIEFTEDTANPEEDKELYDQEIARFNS